MEPWHLTRQTFEEKAEAYLKKFPALIRGCIAASGVKDADIELVILTGGHSQWYFVKEILTGRLPAVCGSLLPQITEDPNRILSVARPQETVALGLVYAPMASFSGSPAGLADAPGRQTRRTSQRMCMLWIRRAPEELRSLRPVR